VRLRRLDILRGLAVVLVLCRHYPGPEAEVARPVRVVGEMLQQMGWIGVDLFFVLSGFLVSGLLFREYQRHGSLAVGRFWVRRGFKIYPAFYLLLLVTWWMEQSGRTPIPRNAPQRLLYESVYLQNYFGGLWNHTWSLAVEEHFYLVLPLVLAAGAIRGARDPFRRVWPLWVALCAGILAWRVRTVISPQPFEAYLFPTHLRLDSLLWGVLLSYAVHFRDPGWLRRVQGHPWVTLLAIAIGLAPAFACVIGASVFLATWGLTTIALGFTLLLALALPLAPAGGGRRARAPLAALGAVAAAVGVDSYSIYLWHMPVLRWLMPWCWERVLPPIFDPTRQYLACLASYVVCAVLVGAVLARLVERPALALRDRWIPSRSGAVTLPPPAPAATESAGLAAAGTRA